MSRLYYVSNGVIMKRKQFLQIMGLGVCVIAGSIAALAMDAPSDETMFLTLGIAAVVGIFGVVVFTTAGNDYTSRSCLKIYDDHVSGVDSSFQNVPFSLTYDRIRDVQQMSVLANDMLVIEYDSGKAIVAVNDLKRAYGTLGTAIAAYRERQYRARSVRRELPQRGYARQGGCVQQKAAHPQVGRAYPQRG